MQAFGVLDRYIGKTIFNTIMMTLFMLVSLSGIIKFVDQLKKSGQGSYDALGAGLYTILSVPKDIQIFFPMAALLGALLGLGMLAQRSELVVMQASGFTRLQVALAVMKTAIPLVLLTMAIGEWVAPQGEQMARNYRAQAMYGGSLLSTQQGRHREEDLHIFWYAEQGVHPGTQRIVTPLPGFFQLVDKFDNARERHQHEQGHHDGGENRFTDIAVKYAKRLH